jgi:hypothetical protein
MKGKYEPLRILWDATMFFATWSMAFGFPVFVFKTDSVLAKLFLITGGMLFFTVRGKRP